MLLLLCKITTVCHLINISQNKQTKIAVNAELKQSKLRRYLNLQLEFKQQLRFRAAKEDLCPVSFAESYEW